MVIFAVLERTFVLIILPFNWIYWLFMCKMEFKGVAISGESYADRIIKI
jgi:hypothetical protein